VSRHWGFGERLPNAYFVRDYWLTDYLEYALFAPPEGLVWVRVGDDALLIDEYSGEIIEAEYGVFI
jgi:Ni/Co efflux regulator RcnB